MLSLEVGLSARKKDYLLLENKFTQFAVQKTDGLELITSAVSALLQLLS